jgi:hypothetical protein
MPHHRKPRLGHKECRAAIIVGLPRLFGQYRKNCRGYKCIFGHAEGHGPTSPSPSSSPLHGYQLCYYAQDRITSFISWRVCRAQESCV